MNLVLIETSGNQRYIFATNKLRENVGASELTYRAGIDLVLDAADIRYDARTDPDGWNLRKLLLGQTRIEKTKGQAVEVLLATSGKALLLTDGPDKARAIIAATTARALREMPGLSVHGATVELKNIDAIHAAINDVHEKYEATRNHLPGATERFPRLPWSEPCSTSALPACEAVNFPDETNAFSAVTRSKRQALARTPKVAAVTDDQFRPGRIPGLLTHLFKVSTPQNLQKLADTFPGTDWIAVIHADGNGLGQIFLDFDKACGKTGRGYIDAYRRFSLALDLCTINAAGFALLELRNLVTKGADAVPVVPLVLGGDDLTVICDGRYALKFTRDFLAQFERETKCLSTELKVEGQPVSKEHDPNLAELQGIVPAIANRVFGSGDNANRMVERLGICAGVAIVKPHYPFHQAYDLAAELLKSAKQVKTQVQRQVNGEVKPLPCSALDFHILYDSAHSELEEIRERKLKVGDAYLSAKPYVVTPSLDLGDQKGNPWLSPRYFDELQKRVGAMSEQADGKPVLPNGKLHAIRESLARGRDYANAEAGLIRIRLESEQARTAFAKLPVGETSAGRPELFFASPAGPATHFLDAIEAVRFWHGLPTQPVSPSAPAASATAEEMK